MSSGIYGKITFMSTEIESKSFINLGVVVNDQNEILIVKRAKEEKSTDGAMTLTWAFPGGKQKFSESRKDCVQREILDETGYEVEYAREISMRAHLHFPIIMVYHLCRSKNVKPKSKPNQPWEITEVKWVKTEELKNYFTTDLDKNVAAELGLA